MSILHTVNARFSAAAANYDASAKVQQGAAEKLLALLPEALSPRRMLDLGCGSGQLTRRLRARWPAAEIHAVDVAAGMIAEARRRSTDNTHWSLADISTFSASDPFDLVASNCALHWLYPIEQGLQNVSALVSRGGLLACSVMLQGTLKELHASRRRAAPTKLPTAAMPSRELMETLLWQNGFTVVQARDEEFLETFASAHDALRKIHDQGLTGGALSRGRLPLTRGELAKLEQTYADEFRMSDGSIPATYRVGYFLAEKT